METTDRSPQCDTFGIIYKITNRLNGKIFIGKTTASIKRRFDNHKRNFKSYCEKGDKLSGRSIYRELYKAMSHDGVDNFTIEEIDNGSTFEELDSLELYYITKFETTFPAGYNIAKGKKIPQSKDEDTQIFRRHEESKGLPHHCNYNKKKEAYIVGQHPLCNYKQFLVSTHDGSHEKAKGAMLEFLKKIEEDGKPYCPPKEKLDGLPRGISRIKNNGYLATYYFEGKRYMKSFRGKYKPREVLLEKAKKWLEENDPKRKGYSSTTK